MDRVPPTRKAGPVTGWLRRTIELEGRQRSGLCPGCQDLTVDLPYPLPPVLGEAPRLTQARLKLFGLNLEYRIDKAKRELGYGPRISFDQAIKETIAWYKENG